MSEIKDPTIRYSNGDVTVLWKPRKCIYSGICTAELPAVFRPTEKTWINVDSASADDIISQVSRCPSGALSILKE